METIKMLNQYFMTVAVMFHTPQKQNGPRGEKEKLAGYYRNLGMSAFSDDDAKTMASNEITDGNIDWPDSEIKKIKLAEFDPVIAGYCKTPTEAGIWYKSGRSLFPEK